MSERHLELAEGNALVVARTPAPSLATRFAAAGFYLPDQAQMRRMMRLAAWGLSWDSSLIHIPISFLFGRRRKDFCVFTLEQYARCADFTWGAPMPDVVSLHIKDVRVKFPRVDVRVHALRDDDPFIELILDGERLFTMAWMRKRNELHAVYPAARK